MIGRFHATRGINYDLFATCCVVRLSVVWCCFDEVGQHTHSPGKHLRSSTLGAALGGHEIGVCYVAHT
jgi:hypothetical protein